MSTFLMTTPPVTGHLLPVLELAHALSARGHRVLVHTDRSAEAAVKSAGATLIPYHRYTAFIPRLMHRPPRTGWWLPRIPRNLVRFREVLLDSARELAEELEPILRDEQVDCVVYDIFGFGAVYAAERAGIPYASVGTAASALTRDHIPLMLTSLPPVHALSERRPDLVHALVDRLLPLHLVRGALDLPPRPRGSGAEFVNVATSSMLNIVPAPRDFLAGFALRDRQVFSAPTTFNVSHDVVPAPPMEPGTVVVATTTTGKDDGLLRRVLEAIAPMGIPILATAASASDVPTGLGSHVRIEKYIPHDEVFSKAAALITHGGWGTVGRALFHGLPMLIIPLFGDQIMNGRQAERGGLAYHLPSDKATPQAIQQKLRALLADQALRARLQKVAAESAEAKASAVGARALEELAAAPRLRRTPDAGTLST